MSAACERQSTGGKQGLGLAEGPQGPGDTPDGERSGHGKGLAMDELPSVALIIETATSFGRASLRGVSEHNRAVQPWLCYVGPGSATEFPAGLTDWRGDGIIASVVSVELAERLEQMELPVVNISGAMEGLPFPEVWADDRAIGSMVADHFLARGFRRFAYFGFPERCYSNRRRDGFTAQVEAAGYDCETFWPPIPDGPIHESWQRHRRETSEWVRSLGKPTAVMTVDDVQGHTLVEVCRQAGVMVPEEVAIVGVDNDDVLCRLTEPPLSSVDTGAETRGYEAAALLHRMMAGEPAPDETKLVPPRGVISRQSSDVLAIDDPNLAMAVRFIHDRADRPVKVEDILNHVPVSRRLLEQRFVETFGRSPADEIRRVHLERAKLLLAGTDWPVAEVARKSGFTSAKSLSDIFRRHVEETPTDYRRLHRRS